MEYVDYFGLNSISTYMPEHATGNAMRPKWKRWYLALRRAYSMHFHPWINWYGWKVLFNCHGWGWVESSQGVRGRTTSAKEQNWVWLLGRVEDARPSVYRPAEPWIMHCDWDNRNGAVACWKDAGRRRDPHGGWMLGVWGHARHGRWVGAARGVHARAPVSSGVAWGEAAVRITQPSESAAAPRLAPGFVPTAVDGGPPVHGVSVPLPESRDGPNGRCLRIQTCLNTIFFWSLTINQGYQRRCKDRDIKA
jgi:hypothetical protein